MAYATRGAVKSQNAAAPATAVPFHLTLAGADSKTLAPLVAEEKSPDDIHKEIPHNAVLHLQSDLKDGKRYEAQLYGGFTSILTETLRPSRYYEVAPQGVLREVVKAPKAGFNKNHSISVGSTGAHHKSGTKEKKKFPDFICYKHIRVPGQKKKMTYIVTAIELKRDKSSWSKAKIQMDKYMQEMMKHKYHDDEIVGFLIQGQKMAAQFTAFIKHTFGCVVKVKEFNIFGADDFFIRELCRISSDHWNLDFVETEKREVEDTEEDDGEETKESNADETEESYAEETKESDEEKTVESDEEGTEESDGHKTNLHVDIVIDQACTRLSLKLESQKYQLF
ncbi:hypothetical protein GALMADRAFT_213310 [Galerina marginata CBS 339.88]|uniref:Uncharacterized protein n=1 Tax=Galerina marginata (strain CBS 339.88) TaxID=685588 RepID=A0A067SMZ5_GALM3|nr:hypothetical protein GALMADRAFT_213310 [Galerina marginata CBS 339.88]